MAILAASYALYRALVLWAEPTSLWQNLIAEFIGLGLSVLVVYLIVERAIEEGQKRHWQAATTSALQRLRRIAETWEFFVMGYFSQQWRGEVKQKEDTWTRQATQATDGLRQDDLQEAAVKVIVYRRKHQAAVAFRKDAVQSLSGPGKVTNADFEDWMGQAEKVIPVLQADIGACIQTLAAARNYLELVAILDKWHESLSFLLVGRIGFTGDSRKKARLKSFREGVATVVEDSLNWSEAAYSKIEETGLAIKPEILRYLENNFPQ